MIPRIGLGTFNLTGAGGLEAIVGAIGLGYRHLDTAQTYGTEENVGTAIRLSGRKRSEFFVTTKVTPGNFGRLEDSVDDSLEAMGLEYADLVLAHWPAPKDNPPVNCYIRALARTQDIGKTRLIGVSNFTRSHIDEAIAEIGTGRLATNQIEQHLFHQNRVVAGYCRDAGIAVTAYMPLAGGRLDGVPLLEDLARKHQANPSQIALAFLLELGSIVIPKSGTPRRQEQNLASAEIRLDASDIDLLSRLDTGARQIDPEWGPKWD